MTVTARLADLADLRRGYSTRRAVKAVRDGTHHILQMRDFDDARTGINTADLVRFSPGPVAPENELRPGDVLFLAKGSRNFACVPAGLPPHTLAANYFFIIRPETRVLPEYIAWFLNRPATLDRLARFSGGGVHTPVIRKGVLAGLELPEPPMAEQCSIIEIDALVRREHNLHTELNTKRKILYDAVCMRAATQRQNPEPPQ